MILVPMIQNLETTLRVGAVPQVPQFRPQPSPAAANAKQFSVNGPTQSTNATVRAVNEEVKSEDTKSEEPTAPEKSVPPVVKPSVVVEEQSVNGVADPLGNARSKVQDEIGREFAAIMATGTLRASEAAALATRRVMQRYGNLNVAVNQS